LEGAFKIENAEQRRSSVRDNCDRLNVSMLGDSGRMLQQLSEINFGQYKKTGDGELL